jgi:hypothetical protein
LKGLNVIADRTPVEGIVAVGSASLAFMLALPLYSPDVEQVSHVLIGGSIGVALITFGFGVASRTRPLPQRGRDIGHSRLALLAAGLGAALGLGNLVANWSLAMLDVSIRRLLVERFSTLNPWGSVVGAPIVEEVVMRLVLMSVVAWIAARLIKSKSIVFRVALWTTALAFGLLHVFRPVPESSPLDVIYLVGVVLKSGMASLLLGWVFWRWGLPYAILCHALANATHRLLEPLVF